jgi:hypothetical protein
MASPKFFERRRAVTVAESKCADCAVFSTFLCGLSRGVNYER